MHLSYRVKVKLKNILCNDYSSGFTLLEILVIVLIIGVLAGLALPNWLSFIERSRLNAAQDKVYLAMRQAQRQASKDKLSNQVSFREQDGIVQWSVHQAEPEVFIPNYVANNQNLWQSLEPSIHIEQQLNLQGKSETTLPQQTIQNQKLWRIVFNYQGCPVYQVGDECGSTSLQALGQLTLYSDRGGQTRRCVYISTILGAMRKGKEHSNANENDKYCY
ncbi:prepilin-type N-terminal cleavage/methylation domain-containing protein [Nostoc sp. CHAB 5844]|nr:prepilin-type N-terminal cleavage/methylation domain-containing protein [Nostoc sp. CHAB 5844]